MQSIVSIAVNQLGRPTVSGHPLWLNRLPVLPPATIPGREPQRVSVARGFAPAHPVLLLDEPTASLDAANRAVVVVAIATIGLSVVPSPAGCLTHRPQRLPHDR